MVTTILLLIAYVALILYFWGNSIGRSPKAIIGWTVFVAAFDLVLGCVCPGWFHVAWFPFALAGATVVAGLLLLAKAFIEAKSAWH